MTVSEMLAKLASRDFVRPDWIMHELNMSPEKFSALFGNVEVSEKNGFLRMAVADVVPILESL